jgi:hypothetical protein
MTESNKDQSSTEHLNLKVKSQVNFCLQHRTVKKCSLKLKAALNSKNLWMLTVKDKAYFMFNSATCQYR